MKTKSDKWQVSSDKRNRPASGSHPFHPSPVTRHFEKGIALIITLILLSVTLVMALAFLAISRRENSAVATAGDTATARLAADAALASAEAQTMAGILSSTNPYNFGLIVSTNYINPNGFDATVPFQSINYDHLIGSSAPLLQNQFLTMLTNLWYSPRPPVFVPNPPGNYASPLSYDFRFYLDLNRNGKFDTNGWVTNVDINGLSLGTTSFQVGDPEWIGVLAHPDQPYGLNNPFVARFAFIALPVGNSLDLNAIHNQTFDSVTGIRPVNPPPVGVGDVFFRNQGVGSWEINLAAFLADLNTNQWGEVVGSYPNFPIGSANWYQYDQANPTPSANVGTAFDDARALLAYRYNNNYSSLYPVGGANGLFTTLATFPPFQNDIDAYSDGPLQTNTPGIYVSGQAINLPWAGADNTNHFFTPSDLFDTTKTEIGVTGFGFTKRLLNAGTGVSTYDRYTFYRLLSQLGTDTTPETGKMNLNYRNITNGVIVPGMETNFYAWTALEFFTNAADRMLRAYTANWINQGPNAFGVFTNTFGASTTNAFGIGNIPVYVNGQFVYTPAVNRILQLAANIYDATTSQTDTLGNNLPSVFRPLLTRTNAAGNIYISGFVQQTSLIKGMPLGDETNVTDNPDLALPVEITSLPVGQNMLTNVYGVPWIIGAKKGLPNFNKFSMESAFQITRKLQFTRNTNSTPWQYASNQIYFMGITNLYGVQCWNSYHSNYTGPVSVMSRLAMQMDITNDAGYTYNPYPNGVIVPSVAQFSTWNALSFILPFVTNATFNFLYVSNGSAIYLYGNSIAANNSTYPPQFIPQLSSNTNYLDKGTPPLPHFVLLMTNRLQVAIIDYSDDPVRLSKGHVIDYVQLNGMDATNDLNSEIAYLQSADGTSLWDTNLVTGSSMTVGVNNQFLISKNGNAPAAGNGASGAWTTAQIPGLPRSANSPALESLYFNKFFANSTSNSIVYNGSVYPVIYTSPNLQAPYTPSLNRVQRYTWQANDPLVHYLIGDLNDTANDNNPQFVVDWPWNLIQINDRYMPWGGGTINLNTPDNFNTANAYNMTLKDPLVASSDNWDFPTNKFPTIGWIGRVHRGTPWQTVYLKSSDILAGGGITNWTDWTGNQNYFDATNSSPTQDRTLFDLFTTAFNDNATRGQLSVNVGAGSSDPAAGLAAWSALFSGVVVPTNVVSSPPFVIQPAGAYNATLALTNQPPLAQIVAGINATRAGLTNLDGLTNTFEHVGDILRTPQLTEQFLKMLGITNTPSDAIMEWLPQQTMSLLRVGTPRYVIYSYGQTLKPAPNGVSLGTTVNGTFGMVTNYQVVSEMATRAVVRFDSTLTNILGTNRVINNHAVIENYNILPPD
jgi:hypothetical protein